MFTLKLTQASLLIKKPFEQKFNFYIILTSSISQSL